MRSLVGLNLAFLAVLVLTGLFTGIAFAAQPNQGYVKYSVSCSGGQTGLQPNSFTLNESVVPTSQKGFVDLGLLFSSSNTNLSFSRILNVTSLPEIFPYLPGINGTYSFQSHGMTISASIQNSGTSSTTFNGASYRLTNYSFAVSGTNSSNGKAISLNGMLSSLPSGLIYSAQLEFNNSYTSKIQLLATNLPLVASSSSLSSTTIGVAIVGASVFGAVALAVPTHFRRTKKDVSPEGREETSGNGKPDYWVD